MTMDEQMREEIAEALQSIERQEQVKILYACESGSRAWGFPSRDSDYDVRFVYVRRMDWYMSIDEGRDVIERPIHDKLDVAGWDLKKALRLLRKSNPPLLEWLQSPIRYMEPYGTAERIRRLASTAFSPKSCLYHYLSMAKGNYRDYLQGERVRAKKYFYVLRPILACGWIERYGTMPPMLFGELLDALLPGPGEPRAAIDALLVRKMAGDELDHGPRIGAINDYLEERIAYFERLAPGLRTADAEGLQNESLNGLFRLGLQEAWGNELWQGWPEGHSAVILCNEREDE